MKRAEGTISDQLADGRGARADLPNALSPTIEQSWCFFGIKAFSLGAIVGCAHRKLCSWLATGYKDRLAIGFLGFDPLAVQSSAVFG